MTLQTRTDLPGPWKWTRETYGQMMDLGWFGDRRVELIEGDVIEMSPIGGPHFTSVLRVSRALTPVFGEGWLVSVQGPLDLGASSVPQPDVAVIPGEISDYERALPTTAALIVEVADTSLAYDRSRRAALYARAGIEEYWIVNLVDGGLEVNRNPGSSAGERSRYGYEERQMLNRGESVSPTAAPQARVAVSDLLPTV